MKLSKTIIVALGLTMLAIGASAQLGANNLRNGPPQIGSKNDGPGKTGSVIGDHKDRDEHDKKWGDNKGHDNKWGDDKNRGDKFGGKNYHDDRDFGGKNYIHNNGNQYYGNDNCDQYGRPIYNKDCNDYRGNNYNNHHHQDDCDEFGRPTKVIKGSLSACASLNVDRASSGCYDNSGCYNNKYDNCDNHNDCDYPVKANSINVKGKLKAAASVALNGLGH